MNQENISVLIIDSDSESLNYIKELTDANTLVSVIETAVDSEQALLRIISMTPDLVFLEYPTVGKAGKEIIKYIQNHLDETTLVFTSETKDYASIAIRHGVYNYLLKPVQKEDIERIVSKVHLVKQTNQGIRIRQIIERTHEEKRLRLQTIRGFIILDPEEILYCKADGFYTEIFLTGNRNELSYLFISKLDEILKQFEFVRVSRSYLINMKYIRKIYKASNTIVLSSNGQEYEVKASKQQIRSLSKFNSES
ncbi:MAG: LytTR family DNA-binding domain-containing protein [Prolixibacteraceae bacterium]